MARQTPQQDQVRWRDLVSPACAIMVVATGLWMLIASGQLHPLIYAPYVAFSLAALVAYRSDKAAAEERAWRTPESTLHLFALLGGWPGALLAQRLYHHKTRKPSFQFVFWVTVLMNCGALAWLVLQPTTPPG